MKAGGHWKSRASTKQPTAIAARLPIYGGGSDGAAFDGRSLHTATTACNACTASASPGAARIFRTATAASTATRAARAVASSRHRHLCLLRGRPPASPVLDGSSAIDTTAATTATCRKRRERRVGRV